MAWSVFYPASRLRIRIDPDFATGWIEVRFSFPAEVEPLFKSTILNALAGGDTSGSRSVRGTRIRYTLLISSLRATQLYNLKHLN